MLNLSIIIARTYLSVVAMSGLEPSWWKWVVGLFHCVDFTIATLVCAFEYSCGLQKRTYASREKGTVRIHKIDYYWYFLYCAALQMACAAYLSATAGVPHYADSLVQS